ncbi:ATP-binding cassette, subfamily B, MsbA [Dethiosulfatibacter aminovorans DSM 17477]|uniref:ATP-binding cassette, subfamily B, MsbA n=1 Tax=Dethiosulfatibacter aminovorans DSM 17477 TaxID=1121476 RepID=A0A1M6AV32_9FIRM|nr:ABC transporter ATP-binding protein [Dethiosulfatibacter aminovorans]SHI40083.1 ATP-binding cassette, subfamily B, MsbA [Dethiosulfatibacter aminovorans DSM 17477]
MEKNNMKILLHYFAKFRKSIILGVVGIFVLSLFLLPTPFITRYIIDDLIPNKNTTMLISLLLILLLFIILQKVISYLTSYIFIKINSKIIIDLRSDLLKKILMMKVREKEQFTTGYLISRIQDDTKALQSLFVNSFAGILREILKFIFGFIALLYLDVKLALITFSLLPVYIMLTYHYTVKIKQKSSDTYEKTALMTSQLEESLSLSDVFKIFGKEILGVEKYHTRLIDNYTSYMELSRNVILNGVLPVFILDLIPIIIIGIGGLRIIEGTFTLGSLVAFTNFISFIFGPANRIIGTNIQIQQGLVALDRVVKFWNIQAEESGTKTLQKIRNIEFDNVSFRYPQSPDKIVIQDLNLEIMDCNCIGLKGISGKGKSTVAKLMLRLYSPQSGLIKINGLDIMEYDVNNIRNKIGYVAQEPLLMNDSILNNVLLGLDKDKEAELSFDDKKLMAMKALDLSSAGFVYELPDGIFYQVKNYGDSLSVGQKQRIAIARVLINQPDVIILDEATANLDSESEAKIFETFNRLAKDIITIIISHDMKILSNCDKIIEL